MTKKPHNLFPYELDQEQTSQLTFQLFNNATNYTLKVYAKPTEDNGKVGSDAKRKAFLLVFPKTPNRQSMNKMKRSYGHIEGLSDHCDALLEISNNNSMFAQCRKIGQKSSYFKFFDAVITPSHNATTLTIKLFDDVITLMLPPKVLEQTPSKTESIKLFHFILDSHNFDLDEMTFEPEVLATVIHPSFAKVDVVKEELKEFEPTFNLGEDVDKNSEETSITDKDDKAFILSNKHHLSALVAEDPSTTIAQQLLDMMNKSELQTKTKQRVMMLNATIKRMNNEMKAHDIEPSRMIELQKLQIKLTSIINDIKKPSLYDEVMNGANFQMKSNFYQEIACTLHNNLHLLSPSLQDKPFLQLFEIVANNLLDSVTFLKTGNYKTAMSEAMSQLQENHNKHEQTIS